MCMTTWLVSLINNTHKNEGYMWNSVCAPCRIHNHSIVTHLNIRGAMKVRQSE